MCLEVYNALVQMVSDERMLPMLIQQQSGSTEKQIYTARDVASILQISVRKAYDMFNNNPAFEVIRLGKIVRAKRASFDSWFDSKGC